MRSSWECVIFGRDLKMDFKSLLGIFWLLLLLWFLLILLRFFVICASFSNFTSNLLLQTTLLALFSSVYVLLVFLGILKNSEKIISPLGSNILEFCGKCCKNVIIISTSFLCYFSIVWLHDFGTL